MKNIVITKLAIDFDVEHNPPKEKKEENKKDGEDIKEN